MRKQKSRQPKDRRADLLTSREQRVFSLMREGLSDEQIAERLAINVATVEYEVWGVLSKLGFESRAQAAAWGPAPQLPLPEPPHQLPLPEPPPHKDSRELVREAVAATAPTAPEPRINLGLAAQAFGIGLALFGVVLIAWGVVRLARDDQGELSVAVRTPSPVETTATTPGPTNPAPTVTPFPTVIPEEPVAFGQFGFLRSLYSITPDGSEFYTVLPRPPRAYALSPDAAQLAYVQGYGDIDLKFISADGGEAMRTVRLDGIFNVNGLAWPSDGSRVVLSVQVPDANIRTPLKDTIALLDLDGDDLTILDSAPLLPNGLITLPGETPGLVPHPNSGAALSPDGAYVAWPSDDGRIQIAPVSGDVPPAVVEGHLPAWSADSSRLAFQAGSEIHIVDRDGAGEEVLAPGGQPAWAPADSIAFIRDGELFVIDPDTAEETQLTGIDLPFASSPRWSPDGERILFTYAPLSPEIFTVDPNGEDRTLLVPGTFPQWSPDGASIAFASGGDSNGGNLYVMTADAGAITALPAAIAPNEAIPLDPGCHFRPFQWSPLGDRIAFCHSPKGPIEIVGLTGEPPVLVGSGTSFSWAPDGDRIAFTGSEGADTRSVIYIADLAQPDAPPQRLAEGTTPDWSPDGAKIAYAANDGLHIADLATGDNVLIAGGEISRSHVSWAPDSSRLAYVSAGRILIADLASSDAPAAIAEGLDPKWSPDGTQLAYHTRDAAGHEDLWAVPADASAPPRHLGKGRNPAWSPDSTRLAYDRFIP